MVLIPREAGGTAGTWRAWGWGGRPSLECVLGGWPAPGWPDCRQARACLLGVVPPHGLPGSPTIPLETKAPATPPGTSASRRAQTHLLSSPWTSMRASACEAPLLGMPFPHFCEAWYGVASSRKSSLFCSPGCMFCVSGAQVPVHFKAWTEPQGRGLQLCSALGLTQWLRAHGLRTRDGQPQGRAPGPWVQPLWQRPLGEEAGPGGIATVHVHSSPKDGSQPCLVVSGWQDSGPFIHPACRNLTNAPSGSPGRPGPAPASHCLLHSLIALGAHQGWCPGLGSRMMEASDRTAGRQDA